MNRIFPWRSLQGTLELPGDKSISHRLALASLFLDGSFSITNMANGEDVKTSLNIIEQLGCKITYQNNNSIEIKGLGGLQKLPSYTPIINCQNSGTTARLLTGILAGSGKRYSLTGDSSLSKRPMGRILTPLKAMGCDFITQTNSPTLPFEILPPGKLQAAHHELSISSAQVKSAIIFAALSTKGKTSLNQPLKSRDHTELLLKKLGCKIETKDTFITVEGPQELNGEYSFSVPGDPSSAAFFAIAAAIKPGNSILFKNLLLNPTRTKFLEVIKAMGTKIDYRNIKDSDWEKSGDVLITGADLRGISISPHDVPYLIDELPILTIAMCFAQGKSLITGASELRTKESDRISCLLNELRKLNVELKEFEDGYEITGLSSPPTFPDEFNSYGDHRLAMAFSILSEFSEKPIKILQADTIKISFPDFFESLEKLKPHRL